jgi:hypothetical protein
MFTYIFRDICTTVICIICFQYEISTIFIDISVNISACFLDRFWGIKQIPAQRSLILIRIHYKNP